MAPGLHTMLIFRLLHDRSIYARVTTDHIFIEQYVEVKLHFD